MSKQKQKNLSIFIDGAARGNPGPAGIGVVITDSSNNLVKELCKYIGEATNNVAEYSALIFGMEQVIILGANELTINTDSELLAKQLSGEYKVKNDKLKQLYAKVIELLDSFQEVKVNNIPREKNKDADKLANKAIDDLRKKRTGKSFVLKKRNSSLF